MEINYKSKLTYKISSFNRKRKYNDFINNFLPTPDTTILDVGYNDNEYRDTENYLEKNYPYQSKITALGIMEPKNFNKSYPEVKTVSYDGNNFPFGNKEFDICWSNAVIEHVGNFDKQVFFVKELIRTGKSVFFTTPNRLFPVEIHNRMPLLHYLPKSFFDRIMISLNKTRWTGDNLHILSYRKLLKILKAAGAVDYKIIRNKILGLTLDFTVIIKSTD
ncbi:MAG: methyltransferase domain-containing protein [Ignavibacteriaceae bacterium]|nr:methyltransferase domain-containing protein [Ignavibacteriaceae bacterium]